MARTRRKNRKEVEETEREKLMVSASLIAVQSPGVVRKSVELRTKLNAESLARKYARVGYLIGYWVNNLTSPFRFVNTSQINIPRVPTSMYRVISNNVAVSGGMNASGVFGLTTAI